MILPPSFSAASSDVSGYEQIESYSILVIGVKICLVSLQTGSRCPGTYRR
jgi:hypothetical protein